MKLYIYMKLCKKNSVFMRENTKNILFIRISVIVKF